MFNEVNVTSSDIKKVAQAIKDTLSFDEECNTPLEYDSELIDLTSVLDTIKRKRLEFEKCREEYVKKLENKYDTILFCIHDYKFDDIIRVSYCYKDNVFSWTSLKLKYENGILSQVGSNYNLPSGLINYLKEIIFAFNDYEDYYNEKNDFIKPVNSDFNVSISRFGVTIYLKGSYKYFNVFNINGFSYTDLVDIETHNIEIRNLCNEYSKILFNKILVRIEDCPKWMRDELRSIKQKQFENVLEYKKDS